MPRSQSNSPRPMTCTPKSRSQPNATTASRLNRSGPRLGELSSILQLCVAAEFFSGLTCSAFRTERVFGDGLRVRSRGPSANETYSTLRVNGAYWSTLALVALKRKENNMRKTFFAVAAVAAVLSVGAAADRAAAMTAATPAELGLATGDDSVVQKAALVCGRWGCRRVWRGPHRVYAFAGPRWHRRWHRW
jgi:hypothetical protein